MGESFVKPENVTELVAKFVNIVIPLGQKK